MSKRMTSNSVAERRFVCRAVVWKGASMKFWGSLRAIGSGRAPYIFRGLEVCASFEPVENDASRRYQCHPMPLMIAICSSAFYLSRTVVHTTLILVLKAEQVILDL